MGFAGVKKPQYIIDDTGKRVGVLLSIEDYESLMEIIDKDYCNTLYQKATEVNEPNQSSDDYLKKGSIVSANEFKEDDLNLTTEDINKVKALYEVYSNLPQHIKTQFHKFIFQKYPGQIETSLTALSEDSFAEIWDSPENEHWTQFINDKLNV